MIIHSKIWFFCFFFLVTGCEVVNNDSLSKQLLKEKKEKAAIDAPTGKPIETPDLYQIEKIRVQTRGVIAFELNGDLIADVDEISLFNDSSKATFLNKLLYTEDLNPDTSGFALLTTNKTVNIYPGMPSLSDKMIYGKNTFRLLVSSDATSRVSYRDVTLQDFAWSGLIFNGAGDDDSGEPLLSGGFTAVAQGMAVSSEAQSLLMTNMTPILTH